jgi:beta-ribofuranosylaminobenzene 5'-phosphate synthase
MTGIEFFDAGSSIMIGDLRRPSAPKQDAIRLKFPGRIHVTPIDCNRFDFGRPGGGGIGFAIEMENYLEASLGEEDSQQAPPDKALLLKHVTAIAKAIFGYQGGLTVSLDISRLLGEHRGFGSTTALMTSCFQAMNLLFGSPLSQEEIRRLVAYNFVEVCGGKLARAMETGVGTYVILNGGLAVLGDDLRTVYVREFLSDHHVALIDPGSVRPSHEEPENVPVFLKSQQEDLAFRYQKSYIILMDLIPALYRNDVRTIGEIFWRFQFSGTNLFLIQNYKDGGLRILRIMTELRAKGIPIVGLSSVGPTIYALSTRPELIHDVCDELGAPFALTRVENRGITTVA